MNEHFYKESSSSVTESMNLSRGRQTKGVCSEGSVTSPVLCVSCLKQVTTQYKRERERPPRPFSFRNLQVLRRKWNGFLWVARSLSPTAECPRSLRGRQEAFCSGPWGKSRAQSSCCRGCAAPLGWTIAAQNSSCLGADSSRCMPWGFLCRTLVFSPPFLALANRVSLWKENKWNWVRCWLDHIHIYIYIHACKYTYV